MNAVKAEGAMLRGSVSFWVDAMLAKQRNAIRKQEHGCMSPCHVSAGIPGRLALSYSKSDLLIGESALFRYPQAY
jgi:hypothetical protein